MTSDEEVFFELFHASDKDLYISIFDLAEEAAMLDPVDEVGIDTWKIVLRALRHGAISDEPLREKFANDLRWNLVGVIESALKKALPELEKASNSTYKAGRKAYLRHAAEDIARELRENIQ